MSTVIATTTKRRINVEAYEAYPKEGYRREHDMSINSIIEI